MGHLSGGSAPELVGARRDDGDPPRHRSPGPTSRRTQRASVGARVVRALGLGLIAFWCAVIAVLWGAANVPVLVGWQSRLVVSGSMEPGIHAGDIVVIAPAGNPDTLRFGQVILVSAPRLSSGSYLHRLVGRTHDGLMVTKGDANQGDDTAPVPPSAVLGQARLVVPLVGYPVLWLRNHDRSGAALPAVVVLALVAVIALGRRRLGRRGPGRRVAARR